jgi:hypothetical protein
VHRCSHEPGEGGNPNRNPRFRNAGGGYKSGVEERDDQVENREVDPWPKVSDTPN